MGRSTDNLNQDERSSIKRFIDKYGKVSIYKAGRTILRAGDELRSRHVYYLIEGSVRVFVEDTQEGREIVLAYLHAGEFFGEMSLLSGQNHRSAYVRTKTECKIAEINRGILDKRNEPEADILLNKMSSQVAQRLLQANTKLADFAFVDVKGRVKRALQDLCQDSAAEKKEMGIQINVSRQELADIVGCSREMVSRVLSELKEENIILIEGRSIVLLDSHSH